MTPNNNLVKCGACTIKDQGGSLYLLIPKVLKDEFKADCNVLFLREPNSTDVVIRIEKKQVQAKPVK